MMTTGAPTSYRELNEILDRARSNPDSVHSISDDQLVGLQRRWTRALSARLDRTLEFADPPLVDAVTATWCELAAEQATLRWVLDAAERRSAALSAAMNTEFRHLALAANMVGVDDPGEPAIRRGRAYRDLIRSGASLRSTQPSTSSAGTRAA